MVNYDGLYNKEFYSDKLKRNHFSDKILGFRVIENGTKINENRRISGKNLDNSGMTLIFAASFFKKTKVKIRSTTLILELIIYKQNLMIELIL